LAVEAALIVADESVIKPAITILSSYIICKLLKNIPHFVRPLQPHCYLAALPNSVESKKSALFTVIPAGNSKCASRVVTFTGGFVPPFSPGGIISSLIDFLQADHVQMVNNSRKGKKIFTTVAFI
jgi:hypothetical protein